MKKHCSLLLAFFPIVAHAASTAPSEHYKNARGSTLTLIRHATDKTAGSITGFFTTAVASSNCQFVIGKPAPISGYYNGNIVSFSVSYPKCGSIISITGNQDSQKNIQTQWIVAKQAKQIQGKSWNTRYIGNDTFERISTKPTHEG